MRASPRKTAILDWMRAIVSQYVQYGAAIDDYAMEVSPQALRALDERVSAFNFSPERYAMVWMNNHIDTLFYACSGINGLIDYQVWNYFRRCCHNTAHISAVGMNALQIRAARADPTSLTFGQENLSRN